MKAADLQKNFTGQTQAIAYAAADQMTANYLRDCLLMMFSGMYGEISEEDTAANNAELEAGEGRILARYKAYGKLTDDIYIIAYFSESNPDDIDYNYTMIEYRSEY